jgi:hypothetical protein
VIAGLVVLALTPLLSFYTLDLQKIYPGYLVWGRSLVRLAIAGLLYFLKPREKYSGPVGGFWSVGPEFCVSDPLLSNQRLAREMFDIASRSGHFAQMTSYIGYIGERAPAESVGRKKPANFAKGARLVIPGLTFRLALRLAFRLALLPGHGIKSSRLLLNVLAAALGAFRVYLVFLEREN